MNIYSLSAQSGGGFLYLQLANHQHFTHFKGNKSNLTACIAMHIYKQTYYKPNLNTMKNIFRILMAVAVLFTASCAKEDISSSIGGGEVEVTFTANLPELGTRAYGDGIQATTLRYYVYDSNNSFLEGLSNTTGVQIKVGSTTTVNLVLIKGMTYNILFWADSNNGYYTVENGTVSLANIDSINANDESRDAFYAAVKGFNPADANADTTIELYRPFAQLNAKVTNMDEVNKSITVTSTTISTKIYTTFNPFAKNESEVVGGLTANPVEFTATPMTAEDIAAGHLSMNYLLAPADGCVADVAFTFNNNKGVAITGTTYTNVPLKANYRTNIIGALLTNSTDFTVEIKPAFGEPDVEEWESIADGVVLMNNTYLITSLNGLKWFADATNGITRAGGNTFKGKTVQLGTDIDLNNELWTPIAANGKFEGKFDGGNHTISNLKVKVDDRTPAGLFARASYVSNLKLENVSVEGHYKAGAVVGDGLCSRIENCHVLNGTIETSPFNKDDGNHAGGITGYLSAENNAWVKNCSVKNVTVIAYRDCGALIGTVNGSKNIVKLEVNGNTVENVTVIANMLPEYVADKEPNAGEIVGRNIKNVDLTDNTATNVVVEVLKFDEYDTLEFKTAAGFDIIAANIAEQDGYAGKTIKLANDIDLNGVDFEPIGYNNSYSNDNKIYFEGTFDGNNKTIKNLKRTDLTFANKRAIGLFSQVKNAVVKNLTMEDFVAATYGGEAAAIACEAVGDCTFENLTFKKGSVVGFNNDTAPVIGWANKGNFTLKNIVVSSDVVIYSLWDAYGTALGGLIGTLESPSTVTIDGANISCKVSAYNDVCSNYQWWIYRASGMIIGNMYVTQTVDGRTIPDPKAAGVTCKNVVVNYGDWMNYHYCEFEANGHPSYATEDQWKFSRVEGSEWAREEDIDTDNCQHDDDESHNILIPFDQLFGGGTNGDGRNPVYGLREYEGVTVNYPASYRREVSSAAALTEALGKGVSVVLDADIDFGSTQLAITGENQVVDLGGHALTTANNWGGISLKNGAVIKNGTITHSGNTAAIKAFNGCSVENVTINATSTAADKTITGIAVQQGANVESIKNVTINGVSQGIEVGYQATVGLIENAVVNESNNGTAKGIGLVINGGKVGKAKNCTFKGETYGVTMHLKGVFAAGLELENCTVEGTTASIYAWDEKGISNTSGSLVLTYDVATTLTGPFVWDFEDECKSVVTLNRPE